jgi:hypothetical protein
MVHRFDVPLAARNQALRYLADESRFSDDIREQLTQVVHGYVGSCDPVALGRTSTECGAISGSRADAEVLSNGLRHPGKPAKLRWAAATGSLLPLLFMGTLRGLCVGRRPRRD